MKTLQQPFDYRLSVDRSGLFLYWQHKQEAGDNVYQREFTNPDFLDQFLTDRYGARYAKKIRKEANVIWAAIHGKVTA